MRENDKRSRRLKIVGGAVALAAIAAAAVLYGKAPGPGKVAGDCPAASAERAARLAPLAHGEIAALAIDKSPKPATSVAFSGADGRKLTLDDFRGKAIVLNLWATWCVPCRAEMPALDRLEAKAGSRDFQVVAVNVDTARLDRPKAFLDEIGVKSLTRYADPSGDAFENLRLAGKALGLPTSLLIDKDGCQLGVVAGPVDWASDDALKVVEALKGS
ncbi:MAG: TlpA family protein disulfide reductase [Hyphomicrobiales bacterium]|nr:TlpA family protein disulfide reductase [Hyphomicrobiales bacterium]